MRVWQMLVAAALADGPSRLRFSVRDDDSRGVPDDTGGVLDEDARGVLAGLESLGVGIRVHEPVGKLEVQGVGGHWSAGDARLDGSSPTAAWALAAACAVGVGRYEVTCPQPASDTAGLVHALHDLGVGIGYADQEKGVQITLLARGLAGGTIRLPAEALPPWWPAVLLVAPYAREDVFVDAPPEAGVREHSAGTLALMERFGVTVIADRGGRMIIPAPQRYRGVEM